MTNIQNWLDVNYPRTGKCMLKKNWNGSENKNFGKTRSEITVLNLETGIKMQPSSLVIEGFNNLEELRCISNSITSLEIKDCNEKLKRISCQDNQLRELNVQIFPNLERIICHNNLLTSLNLDINNKLKYLNIMDNNFSDRNLTFLENLIDLKELRIGNQDKKKTNNSSYNRFRGSLKYLKNMRSLERLDIRNTDVSKGLEYLSDSVKLFCCLSDIRVDAGVGKIFDYLKKQYNAELFSDDDDLINLGYVKDFSGMLQDHKKKTSKGDDKDKKTEKLKSAFREVLNDLGGETFTNEIFAEVSVKLAKIN